MAKNGSQKMKSDKSKDVLDDAQRAVEDLFIFRDTFFEHHELDLASEKNYIITAELNKTLAVIDAVPESAKSTAFYHMLRGKALNIMPVFDQSAMDFLTKAVKLEPSLMEAWIHLGECYWKKGDVGGAHNCFLGALNHGKDKRTLRNLSMVLRQLGTNREEKLKYIQEGVDKAKEALSLDVKDGTSWFILGNAYLSQFFHTNQDPKVLQLCSSAYGQAEKDTIAKNNPDLHFNRSTVHKYNEYYKAALEGFCQATALDPTWEEPPIKEQQLLKYLSGVQELIQNKGKIKGKKLQSLLRSIKDSDLGVYDGGQYTSPKGKTTKLESKLFDQLTAGANRETVILGRVVGSVLNDDTVPFTFCMVDREGTCVAVTVYNIAPENGFKINDAVAIPEPWLEHVNFAYKDHIIDFRSVRVDNPVVLVVNGRKQGLDAVAPAVLSTSVMSS